MADRHVIYKQGAKEIAIRQGLAITFMAKMDERYAGSSMHLHSSLRSLEKDEPLFAGARAGKGGAQEFPDLFRWWLGGLIRHAKASTLLFAPTSTPIRDRGSFAPTRIAWSMDNRTVGFRIVGRGPALRVECRVPGADANPYLAFAATLAAGLDGIEKKTEPPPMFRGDAYAAQNLDSVPHCPRPSLTFEASDLFGAAFGPTWSSTSSLRAHRSSEVRRGGDRRSAAVTSKGERWRGRRSSGSPPTPATPGRWPSSRSPAATWTRSARRAASR
jgi:glutamine synthetase